MKGILRAVFNKDARKEKDRLFIKCTNFYDKLSAWDKCCMIEQIQADLQKEYDKNASLYYSNFKKCFIKSYTRGGIPELRKWGWDIEKRNKRTKK